MKLTTRYLGLTLAHPFMPGASCDVLHVMEDPTVRHQKAGDPS